MICMKQLIAGLLCLLLLPVLVAVCILGTIQMELAPLNAPVQQLEGPWDFRPFEALVDTYVETFRVSGTSWDDRPGAFVFDNLPASLGPLGRAVTSSPLAISLLTAVAAATLDYIPDRVSLYGSCDVLSVLATVNSARFQALTDKQKAAWAHEIQAFQNARSGHFISGHPELEFIAGFQPYHASAYATMALTLLGRVPVHPPKWATDFAEQTPAAWIARYTAILDGSEMKGLNNGWWTSSHEAAAYPAVLLMTPGLRDKYSAFFDWMYAWLPGEVSPECAGFWCKDPAWAPPSVFALGGSYHLYEEYEADRLMFGSDVPVWPFPKSVAVATMAMQLPSGRWRDTIRNPNSVGPACLDFDGIWTVTRSILQLTPSPERAALWQQAEIMCKRFLARAHFVLTNPHRLKLLQTHSHTLPGGLLAVAECQKQFPALVLTENPWQVVSDYAPYI